MSGVLVCNEHLFVEENELNPNTAFSVKLCHRIRCSFDHGVFNLSDYTLIDCHSPCYGTFLSQNLRKVRLFSKLLPYDGRKKRCQEKERDFIVSVCEFACST